MKSIKSLVRRIHAYIRDQSGVSTAEYALILVAVVAIVGAAAALLDTSFTKLFTDLGTQITDMQSKLKT